MTGQSQRPASAVILDLIAFAGEVLPRATVSGGTRDRLGRIAAAMSEAERRHRRQFLTGAPSVLHHALDRLLFHRTGGSAEGDDAVQWEMVCGALLPLAKKAARAALDYENRVLTERG